MKIYLLVKTHSKTGLKYLCKTTKRKYEKYSGSGVYWRQHLKVHGKEHSTELIRECSSKEELREWGLHYSALWNVSDSEEWANLIPEDGGSEEAGKLGAAQTKKLMWINDGLTETMVDRTSVIPEGFTNGRLVTRMNTLNQHDHCKGTKWWNNGTCSVMSVECPDGFVRGRLSMPSRTEKARQRYEMNPKLCRACEEPLIFEYRKNQTCSSLCATQSQANGQYKRWGDF
jgi:hypothetical protein